MERQLRFGIVGCGVIGGTHADAIAALPEAELAAVVASGGRFRGFSGLELFHHASRSFQELAHKAFVR